MMGILGNRSSVDESKVSDPEDETTVVEPDQGNGRKFQHPTPKRGVKANILVEHSPLAHHLTASAWSRSQPRRPTYLHSRTSEYARKNHQVRR
jgi:hypothetical protein